MVTEICVLRVRQFSGEDVFISRTLHFQNQSKKVPQDQLLTDQEFAPQEHIFAVQVEKGSKKFTRAGSSLKQSQNRTTGLFEFKGH